MQSAVFAQNLRFTVLHTNDEHSTLLPSPMANYLPGDDDLAYGGFARLATMVQTIRTEKLTEQEPVVLFSGGDIFGGSPFAWLILNDRSAEIELMNHIGYDAIVVGNHEFDYGPDVFASYLKNAGYPDKEGLSPVISSNIEIPDGHALESAGIQPFTLIELENGLTLGVMGFLGKDAVSVAPYAEPITFKDQHETAREMVGILKQAGADVIISVNHSGIPEDKALAEAVPQIDLIVGGHDHQEIHEPIIVGKTIIVQSGYYLRNLGRIELEYDQAMQRLNILNDEESPFLIPLDSSVPEDDEVSNLVQQYVDELNVYVDELTNQMISDINKPVAFADQEFSRRPPYKETQVGNFATDAMRLITEEVTGEPVHFAFQGNGVLRAEISPSQLESKKGELPFLDFATIAGLGTGPDMQPGYPIVSVYLTGEEIYRVLEISALLSQFLGNTYFLQVSGLRYHYDPRNTVLFTVPIMGVPLPTYRSVRQIELYTGEGHQQGDSFDILSKDDQLYHVVSDYYVTSFMPMIGDMLPNLQIVLKDKDGNPLDSIDEAVVHRNSEELKVWQTMVEYALALPKTDGINAIPDYYISTGDRIIEERQFPLIFWPVAGLLLLILLIVWGIRKWRKRKRIQNSEF